MTDDLVYSLWVATALMLVLEGFMPFLNPGIFRRAILQMANMPDFQIRLIGLLSMMLGLVLLYWIH